jgi:hypothetical protein
MKNFEENIYQTLRQLKPKLQLIESSAPQTRTNPTGSENTGKKMDNKMNKIYGRKVQNQTEQRTITRSKVLAFKFPKYLLESLSGLNGK